MNEFRKKISITPSYITIAASLFVFIVMLHIHSGLDFISDDAVRQNQLLGDVYAIISFYWGFNGRITADVTAEVLVHHFSLWKLIDCIVYTVIVLLITDIVEIKSKYNGWIIAFLVLSFPFDYFSSAGWVSTTTNYLYPILCLLLIGHTIKKIIVERKVCLIEKICSFLGISYAAFSDQYIITILGLIIVSLLYLHVKKIRKKLFLVSAFVYASILYVLAFFSPGHLYRMHNDTGYLCCFPEYLHWNLAEKIYHGYSSTVAVLIFQNVLIFFLLCFFLAMLGIMRGKKNKIIFVFPLLGSILIKLIGPDHFIQYYDYSCGMPDLDLTSSYWCLGLLLSLLICVSIALSLYLLINNKNKRLFALVLLALGALSREMMGFSSSIYASSYRTFTLFLFCLTIIIGFLIEEINEEQSVYTPPICAFLLSVWILTH